MQAVLGKRKDHGNSRALTQPAAELRQWAMSHAEPAECVNLINRYDYQRAFSAVC